MDQTTLVDGQASYNDVYVKQDGVYWVVLERRFFSMKAIGLLETRDAAERFADYMEDTTGKNYVVQRVELTA